MTLATFFLGLVCTLGALGACALFLAYQEEREVNRTRSAARARLRSSLETKVAR